METATLNAASVTILGPYDDARYDSLTVPLRAQGVPAWVP